MWKVTLSFYQAKIAHWISNKWYRTHHPKIQSKSFVLVNLNGILWLLKQCNYFFCIIKVRLFICWLNIHLRIRVFVVVFCYLLVVIVIMNFKCKIVKKFLLLKILLHTKFQLFVQFVPFNGYVKKCCLW